MTVSILSDRGEERELFDALVEGAFEAPLWSTFLDRLRRVTGADYSVLSFRPPGRPFAEAVTLISGASLPPIDAIPDGYPPGEPPVDEAMTEARPYSLNELLGPRASPQLRLYGDCLTRSGISGVLNMRVQDASGVHAWLTVARRRGDFGPADRALMSALARALRAVLRQHVALERERFEASLTLDAVRRLQFGWFTLDRAGQVLDWDQQGASILSDSGVLSRTASGRLAARPAALERNIFRALTQLSDTPSRRAYAVTLSHDPWLDMLLVPGGRKSISAKATPAVVAYVHGDSWRSMERCEHLAELFRLSPREAQLALAFCRGMTIAEASAKFDLTINTVRNYSKAIYTKTGARGLPDLVRIVMRSVLAIAPDV